MAINPTSPLTGGAQTGFTSPTYTLTADSAPTTSGKQFAVTALGGTQAGVTLHSLSSPFTATYTRPAKPQTLGNPNAAGNYPNVPFNKSTFLVRKGVTPALNQATKIGTVRVEIDIPAGSDTFDAANVRALLSLAIGFLNQQSAGIGDTVISNVL